jgi:hypothetical protein
MKYASLIRYADDAAPVARTASGSYSKHDVIADHQLKPRTAAKVDPAPLPGADARVAWAQA